MFDAVHLWAKVTNEKRVCRRITASPDTNNIFGQPQGDRPDVAKTEGRWEGVRTMTTDTSHTHNQALTTRTTTVFSVGYWQADTDTHPKGSRYTGSRCDA